MASSLDYTDIEQVRTQIGWTAQEEADNLSCQRMHHMATMMAVQDQQTFKKSFVPTPDPSGNGFYKFPNPPTDNVCAIRPPVLLPPSIQPAPVSKIAFLEQTRQKGLPIHPTLCK